MRVLTGARRARRGRSVRQRQVLAGEGRRRGQRHGREPTGRGPHARLGPRASSRPPTPAARRRVLVVDQCEESFAAEHRARRPCTVLRGARDRRAERTGRPWRPPGRPADRAVRAPRFARLLERGLYLLGPLDDAGLRACHRTPGALQAGLVVEPGLVGLLVADVGTTRGRCPCSRTPCRRPGRAARAAPSPSRPTPPPEGSGAPSPSPPKACIPACRSPSSGPTSAT